MKLRLVPVFLLCSFVTDSQAKAIIQSLFHRATNYLPYNIYPNSLRSGSYESLFSCIFACSRSVDCSALTYRYTGVSPESVHCNLMETTNNLVAFLEPRPDTKYMQDVRAVKYLAVALNLTAGDINCNASSTLNDSSSCRNLWDGEKYPDIGTEWISMYEDVGGWVKIQWKSYIDLIAVEILNRCWLAEQCSTLLFEFSNSPTERVGRPCKNGTNWQDCGDMVREFFKFRTPIHTNEVTIVCGAACTDSGSDASWGLQEVTIWKVLYN